MAKGDRGRKVRCPQCGARNSDDEFRCRVCTALMPVRAAPDEPPVTFAPAIEYEVVPDEWVPPLEEWAQQVGAPGVQDRREEGAEPSMDEYQGYRADEEARWDEPSPPDWRDETSPPDGEPDAAGWVDQESDHQESIDRGQAGGAGGDREQADSAQVDRERDRTDSDQADSERAERDRANRNRAERERADRERADQERADFERAAQERADRAQADRERAGRERADQAHREPREQPAPEPPRNAPPPREADAFLRREASEAGFRRESSFPHPKPLQRSSPAREPGRSEADTPRGPGPDEWTGEETLSDSATPSGVDSKPAAPVLDESQPFPSLPADHPLQEAARKKREAAAARQRKAGRPSAVVLIVIGAVVVAVLIALVLVLA